MLLKLSSENLIEAVFSNFVRNRLLFLYFARLFKCLFRLSGRQCSGDELSHLSTYRIDKSSSFYFLTDIVK